MTPQERTKASGQLNETVSVLTWVMEKIQTGHTFSMQGRQEILILLAEARKDVAQVFDLLNREKRP